MPDISRAEKDRRDVIVAGKIAEGVPPVKALLEAGYGEATARRKTEEIVQRSLKNSPMISALEEIGVTSKYLAKKVKKGLKAKKVQRILVGSEVQQFTDIDHATRHRYIETAARLRGEDPDQQITSSTETFEERVRRLRGIVTVGAGPVQRVLTEERERSKD